MKFLHLEEICDTKVTSLRHIFRFCVLKYHFSPHILEISYLNDVVSSVSSLIDIDTKYYLLNICHITYITFNQHGTTTLFFKRTADQCVLCIIFFVYIMDFFYNFYNILDRQQHFIVVIFNIQCKKSCIRKCKRRCFETLYVYYVSIFSFEKLKFMLQQSYQVVLSIYVPPKTINDIMELDGHLYHFPFSSLCVPLYHFSRMPVHSTGSQFLYWNVVY